MATRIFSAVLMLCIAFALGSCKRKGCTDPAAVNYDITADEDDGSCIVCNINRTPYDDKWLPLVDKRVTSPYYNDTVGSFYFDQTMDLPTDRVCGRQLSTVTCKMQSFVPEDMYLDFNISTISGPLYIYMGDDLYVNGHTEHDFGEIQVQNFPPFYKLSMDSLKLTLTGNIIYY